MTSVVSQPHFIFGLRTRVTNNLCFVDEQTVVFPSGNNFVRHNYVQRSQRFISGSERSRSMLAMAISPNRRYLAVSELDDKAVITVFDLQHEQARKRNLLNAGNVHFKKFLCLAFSPDSKYLIGQTGAPEWMLVFWLWEKNKVLATVKTTTCNNSASQVSFNPHNNMQFCVSGTGTFKLFRYSDGALKQSSSAKVDSLNFLCHAWMSDSRVIAGTDTGRLLVFESGDLRKELKMTSAGVHGQTNSRLEMKRIEENDASEGPAVSCVTAILSYSKGFVCTVCPDTICLFEKDEQDTYRRSREIQIPPDPHDNDLTPAACQEIATICISPAEETLAISTDQGQLYSANLSSVGMSREEPLHFEFLSQPFHSHPITGLSTCIRKPLVTTSSLDRSVRIWNYETRELELYKKFQEQAYSVALHPTGLFILVGFSDKLRLMNLVFNDIRTFMEFSVRGCKECAFSHGGHMFAAVEGNTIHIYSFTTFENILSLKGHNEKVLDVEWSLDDSRLVSCGMDGAVYEWNIQTGQWESESILKSCSYTNVAFSSDCKSILAVGTDFSVKEIQHCQVLREVPGDGIAHTALAVSHSGKVVFTGTSGGAIRAIKYPLPMQKEWTMNQAHCGPVTKMVITYDDQFLLTVSEDGCLLISKIIDNESQGSKANGQIVHTEEILITKADLEDKTLNVLELKIRLEEHQMENEYQLRLKEMNYNEKLKELSDKFIQEIESLKAKQQMMEAEMEENKHKFQENYALIAKNHSLELKDLELSYSQKLVVEHQKYQDLQQKHQILQEDYEKQLKSAEQSKTQALDELTLLYETRLQEKTQTLAQCQENAQLKISVLEEAIKQMEEDEEKISNAIQIRYEERLHSEKENNANLKRKANVMTQKFKIVQTQINDRYTDMNKLKQERQNLLGFIRSLESDIEDLKRQISELEKMSQDQDNTICGLKKKNQELEKLKFVLEFQLDNLEKQINPQQDDINAKRERIHQLEKELLEMNKNNAELKLTISDLRLKLRTSNTEMHKQMQKVKHMKTLLQRLFSDLQNCVSFIQEPRKLKDSILRIYEGYTSKTDRVEENSVDDDLQKAFQSQRKHLEETVNSLKRRLSKSAQEYEKVYFRMMRENTSLIAEINELRKELHLVRKQVKDYKAQLAILKKSSKSSPKSVEGAKGGSKCEEDSKPLPPFSGNVPNNLPLL